MTCVEDLFHQRHSSSSPQPARINNKAKINSLFFLRFLFHHFVHVQNHNSDAATGIRSFNIRSTSARISDSEQPINFASVQVKYTIKTGNNKIPCSRPCNSQCRGCPIDRKVCHGFILDRGVEHELKFLFSLARYDSITSRKECTCNNNKQTCPAHWRDMFINKLMNDNFNRLYLRYKEAVVMPFA